VRADLSDHLLAYGGRVLRFTVYAMLILPAVIVMIASFTAGDSLRFPPEGFSLRWYGAALESVPFMTSLRTSLLLAGVTTLISLAIGLSAAMAIDRHRFAGRGALQSFILSPLIIPVVVLGIGLLQFLAYLRLNQTFVGILAGHVLITVPYVVRTMTANLQLFDQTLEQAAMNLRATPAVAFRKITLPILFPAILSSGVFVFVTSFGNVTLSIFLAFGGAVTLPVQIYTYLEHQSDPIVAAVSSIVILTTLLIMLAIDRLAGIERAV
jgi:putative spermidine/putrescine transport system permease protein